MIISIPNFTEELPMFGPHLLLEASGIKSEYLASKDLIHSFIDHLPTMIGMTKITETKTFEYSGKRPEDWGVTSFVVIAESHISIHTFPDKNFMAFDIFSCNDFDHFLVLDIICKIFEIDPTDIKWQVIERGTDFVKSEDF
jgi:S-adenosylmethionine decarboxylase